jgi:hypothetical protein
MAYLVIRASSLRALDMSRVAPSSNFHRSDIRRRFILPSSRPKRLPETMPFSDGNRQTGRAQGPAGGERKEKSTGGSVHRHLLSTANDLWIVDLE